MAYKKSTPKKNNCGGKGKTRSKSTTTGTTKKRSYK